MVGRDRRRSPGTDPRPRRADRPVPRGGTPADRARRHLRPRVRAASNLSSGAAAGPRTAAAHLADRRRVRATARSWLRHCGARRADRARTAAGADRPGRPQARRTPAGDEPWPSGRRLARATAPGRRGHPAPVHGADRAVRHRDRRPSGSIANGWIARSARPRGRPAPGSAGACISRASRSTSSTGAARTGRRIPTPRPRTRTPASPWPPPTTRHSTRPGTIPRA